MVWAVEAVWARARSRRYAIIDIFQGGKFAKKEKMALGPHFKSIWCLAISVCNFSISSSLLGQEELEKLNIVTTHVILHSTRKWTTYQYDCVG